MEANVQAHIKQPESAQVSIQRRYRAAPDKVWRAWTDPQALSQWFGSAAPKSVSAAEIDLCVGGRYRIAFRGSDGQPQEVSGVYQEVVPNRRLVFSWAWHTSPERVSRVSIELKPAMEDGTHCTDLLFVHDRFFDEAARQNHERGWVPAFDRLGEFFQCEASGG